MQEIERDPQTLDRVLPIELPQILERMAFACENQDDRLDRLMTVARRSCAEPALAHLRSEIAIHCLLRGQVDAAASYLEDLPDHDTKPRSERILLAHGWYASATGQYASSVLLLKQAHAIRQDLLCAALLYRTLWESGAAESARRLESEFLANSPSIPRAATFEFWDARAHSFRNIGNFRQCLSIRYRLWRRFRRGPAHLAAASAGRLALTLCESGQWDRARDACLRVELRLNRRDEPPGVCLEYVLNARLHIERCIRKLTDNSPASVSRMWWLDSRPALTRHPARSSIRISASYAQWNLESGLWLADLRAANDNRAPALMDSYRSIFSASESPEVAARTRAALWNEYHPQDLLETREQLQALKLVPDELEVLRLLFRHFPETIHKLQSRFWRLARLIRENLRRPMDRWLWDTALQPVHDLLRSREFDSRAPQSVRQTKLLPAVRFLTTYVRPEQELLYHLAETSSNDPRSPISFDPGLQGRALVFFCCSTQVIRTFLFYRDEGNRVRCLSQIGNGDRAALQTLLNETTLRSKELLYFSEPSIRKLFENRHHDIREQFENQLQDISRLLRFDELCAALPAHVSRIAIHPDAWTASILFAALPALDGQPLVNRFAFSIQPFLARETPPPLPVQPVNLAVPVLSGAPSFLRLESLNSLDLSTILESHGGLVPSCLNPRADRAWLRAHLPDATHLLFIGHGLFTETPGGDRGLVLAPSYGTEYFAAHDLAKIRTPHLGLVSLFCCWAGDSQPTPLSWSFSLSDSFLRAGARNVLACLWPALECFVRDFIPSFYHHLRRSDPERALQSAQFDMAAQGWDSNHWAGFVLRRRASPIESQ